MTHPYSTLIMSALQHVTPERLQKAVCGLADGSLTVTLTRQADNEMRGLVKNGDGKEYGVTLAEASTFCSCPDALYRGLVCKHSVALALHVLRTPSSVGEPIPPPKDHMLHLVSDGAERYASITMTQPPARTIHLMWRNGSILCGEQSPQRLWCWPWPDSISLSTQYPEVCRACVAERNHPSRSVLAACYSENGDSRTLPVSPRLKTLFQEAAGCRGEAGKVFVTEAGALWSPCGFLQAFKRACQRASLEPLGPHVLRHTFASRLAMAGVDLRTVQELLGHKSILMTMRYAHLSPDHKRAAMEALEARFPGQSPATFHNTPLPAPSRTGKKVVGIR
jgi:hypothetical protein